VSTAPTLFDTVRAEGRKFRSVRSSWITGIVTFVLLIGLGALFSWASVNQWHRLSTLERITFNPIGISLGGAQLAQLAVGVLGILFITSEFSSGAITTTLAATPSRWRLLASKAVILQLVVVFDGVLGAFAAFFLGQTILRGGHLPSATLTTSGALRSILLTGLFLLLIAVFAMGIGTLLRHTAGAVSTYVGILLLLPILTGLLPGQWHQDVAKWLPLQLGGDMSTSVGKWGIGHFSPGIATLIMSLYAVGLWTLSGFVFARRDV
jgi:ABC-2 type transport system permease protein